MRISLCDTVVDMSFEGSTHKWLMDAISGYNQIRVAKSLRDKLAFAGPHCIKYTYFVIHFGPVNGPVIFIVFIHDMDATWKYLGGTRGIVFGATIGTRVIVAGVCSWAPTFKAFIAYLTVQLDVCLSQHLSLSLKRHLLCPNRMEFVGHGACVNCNLPALSNHSLLEMWPPFQIRRDVALFLDFLIFT